MEKKVVVADDTFDGFQRHLVRILAESVRDNLKRSQLSDNNETLDELAETIIAGVGAIIDGGQPITLDNGDVIPYLTFVKNEVEWDTLIVSSADGSYLHEMTFGILEDWDE